MSAPFTVSTEEAVRLTGMSKDQLRTWARRGKVLAYKPGREYLFDYQSLMDTIRETAVAPST